MKNDETVSLDELVVSQSFEIAALVSILEKKEFLFILNSRYTTLIENESGIFERLFEECEQKLLIWTGELNEELADIARKFLKAQGYREKK